MGAHRVYTGTKNQWRETLKVEIMLKKIYSQNQLVAKLLILWNNVVDEHFVRIILYFENDKTLFELLGFESGSKSLEKPDFNPKLFNFLILIENSNNVVIWWQCCKDYYYFAVDQKYIRGA